MYENHSVLFEPIKISGVTVKNRFALAPMGPAGLSDLNGVFNQRGVDFYVERAKGGAGLLITGTITTEVDVEQRSQHMPFPRKKPREFMAAARMMNERIHSYDSRIFAQLTAGFGRVLIPFMLEEGAELVGPSMIPNRWIPHMTSREMTTKEVKHIVNAMGESAEICKRCGFDGIQIHAVHEGYLLDQFATELFNRRTDEYGGSLENRLRFASEIVGEIKKRCGSDFPVTVRYSPKHFFKDLGKGAVPGEEYIEKSRDMKEGLEIAKLLEKAGYDALDVDVGCYDSWYWNHPPMYHENGMYLPYAEQVKNSVNIPVITAGRMDDPDFASAAIRDGKTDMVGLARPLLADPYLPRKVIEEKIEDIRPCLSCHKGCLGRMHTLLSCAVNPLTGRESELRLEKAQERKNVLIVGGGLAGCEVARVCALRGHSVTIYEKNASLGGNVIPGGVPDFKVNDRKLIKWYEVQLGKLGVNVKYGFTATKKSIDAFAPDVLVISTGSKPKTIEFPGCDSPGVMTASEALLGKQTIGNDVLIVGGGLVGCETALWLAKQGKKVTIAETLDDILFSNALLIIDPNELMLRDLLEYYGVTKITGATLAAFTGGSATIKPRDAADISVKADTVILSVGYEPDTALFHEVGGGACETYLLGDCKGVRDILNAIWESNEVARFI